MNNSLTKSTPLFSTLNYTLNGEGPIVIAYQLKSPENMGHIIRLAANFSCKKVVFVGDKSNVRESKIRKVGRAATGRVEWVFVDENDWLNHVDDDYKLVAVETSMNSKNITDICLPPKTALLLGNEIYGLSDDVVESCDEAIHIPMPGSIKSMNVSHACCVSLYEWLRQNL